MSIKVESSLEAARPSIDERLPLHNQCASSIDTSLAALGNKFDDDLASLTIKCEFDEGRIDPFPVYGVLDLEESDGMACFNGLNSNDCQICLNSLSSSSAPSPHFCSSTLSQSCSPSSHLSSSSSTSSQSSPAVLLPQLDWVDVQSQLTCDLDLDPELSQLPCLNMDDVCGVARQPSVSPVVPLASSGSLLGTANLIHFEQQHRHEEESRAAANLFDKVLLTDCMLSASSAHHTMLAGRSRCLSFGELSDSSVFRPDTPLSETETPAEAATLTSDELLSDVIPTLADPTTDSPPRLAVSAGRSALASVRIVSRPAITPASATGASSTAVQPSSRSLLKRNHQRVVVQHAGAASRGDAGDHSYSAAQQRGVRSSRVGPFDMLTPSPSQSEHSSDDDMDIMAVSNTWCRRKRMRFDSTFNGRITPESIPTRSTTAVAGTDECVGFERLSAPLRIGGGGVGGASSAAMTSAGVSCQPERRQNHNSMERMRRDLLRDYLHTLRCLVPVTSANERAPKVTVLREAAKFCLQLRAKEEQLAAQKRQLQQENTRLYRQLHLSGVSGVQRGQVWRGSVRRTGSI